MYIIIVYTSRLCCLQQYVTNALNQQTKVSVSSNYLMFLVRNMTCRSLAVVLSNQKERNVKVSRVMLLDKRWMISCGSNVTDFIALTQKLNNFFWTWGILLKSSSILLKFNIPTVDQKIKVITKSSNQIILF